MVVHQVGILKAWFDSIRKLFMNETNRKGSLALSKVCSKLLEYGHEIFIPFSEHSKVDLISIHNNKCLKFQVKHSNNGTISNHSIIKNKSVQYTSTDIDYIAAFLSEKDVVIFIPIYLIEGKDTISIRYNLKHNRKCWWYEDFLNLESNIYTKELRQATIKNNIVCKNENRPSKEELEVLINQLPVSTIAKKYNVSDKAVLKWCKKFQIKTKGRGFWSKK